MEGGKGRERRVEGGGWKEEGGVRVIIRGLDNGPKEVEKINERKVFK